jgi:hypothetical protein
MQSIKQKDRQQGKRNPLHFYSCQRTWQGVQQEGQVVQVVREVQEVQEGLEEVVQEEEGEEEDDDRRQTKAL